MSTTVATSNSGALAPPTTSIFRRQRRKQTPVLLVPRPRHNQLFMFNRLNDPAHSEETHLGDHTPERERESCNFVNTITRTHNTYQGCLAFLRSPDSTDHHHILDQREG